MHSVRETAARLGASQGATYAWIASGRLTAHPGAPVRVTEDSIRRLQYERRRETLARIGVSEPEYAQIIMRRLHPDTTVITRANGQPDPDSLNAAMNAPRGIDVLPLLGSDPAALWGVDVIRAAATVNWPPDVCRTCWARTAAQVHGTREPDGSDACRTLLGPGCTACQTAITAAAAENRTQLRRARQQLQGQERLDQVDRVNRERAAAMRAVREASAQFTRANNQWKQLPEALREGGRSR